MKKLFTILVMLIGFSYPQECEEPIDRWFKLSSDTSSKSYGKLMTLDMSHGYAGTDGAFVYIFVNDLINGDGVVIAFPIGYWETSNPSEFEKELKKEFKDLEDYLKYNKGKGIKIQKQYNNKVGD